MSDSWWWQISRNLLSSSHSPRPKLPRIATDLIQLTLIGIESPLSNGLSIDWLIFNFAGPSATGIESGAIAFSFAYESVPLPLPALLPAPLPAPLPLPHYRNRLFSFSRRRGDDYVSSALRIRWESNGSRRHFDVILMSF